MDETYQHDRLAQFCHVLATRRQSSPLVYVAPSRLMFWLLRLWVEKRWKISLAAIKVLLQPLTLRIEQRKDDVIWRGVGAPT